MSVKFNTVALQCFDVSVLCCDSSMAAVVKIFLVLSLILLWLCLLQQDWKVCTLNLDSSWLTGFPLTLNVSQL